MNWQERVIAIVGGDRREQEIARCAAATGAEVRAYGFPWPDEGIDGEDRMRPVSLVAAEEREQRGGLSEERGARDHERHEHVSDEGSHDRAGHRRRFVGVDTSFHGCSVALRAREGRPSCATEGHGNAWDRRSN